MDAACAHRFVPVTRLTRLFHEGALKLLYLMKYQVETKNQQKYKLYFKYLLNEIVCPLTRRAEEIAARLHIRSATHIKIV